MDRKQFFKDLKAKLLDSIELIYGPDKERKLEGINNVKEYIGILEEELNIKLNTKKQQVNEDEIIMYGAKNNWPAMVLRRDGDVVIKTLGEGKSNWDNVIACKYLKEPYSNNYKDLLTAVMRDDRWQNK